MKWMRWIASWFGRTTKSLGSLGIGLRSTLSGGSPGGWASDHREETAHNTGFNYIAIHAIAAQVAGATVTVFEDGDEQPRRQSRRKALARRSGSFARWKSTYGADDKETEPLPTTHPLVKLLQHPNPFESGADFRYRQAQQIRLTGTCLIWNIPSVSGRTCERYVIPTSMATPVAPTIELPRGGWRINPVASRYTPIVDDGYVECPSWYRILGQIVDARQVQLIRLPHAWYLDDGQSPLAAGARWVDASDAVDTARYHQLRNGIDPSVVWNLPPDVSPDQDEMDRVQAKISAKYGGPENVGRVVVAQSGTSITPLTTAPKDMCYSEGFQDFKAAILALHQTPPVAVGLQEPGAYAAYNASMKAWRHAAIQPLCDMLAESDTVHLAPQFGAGLTVEIESDTVDDTELIEQQLQNDLAARTRTRNEWRAVRGMPPLPGALGEQLVGPDISFPESPVTGSNEASDLHSKQITADCEMSSPADQSSDSSSQIKRSETEYNNDASLRRRMMGDILSRFSDQQGTRADRTCEHEAKAFDASKHPRDDRGRFATTGSHVEVGAGHKDSDQPQPATDAEIVQARRTVADILSGKHPYVEAEQLDRSLSILPTTELVAIHREMGFTDPPMSRDHLTSSVDARVGSTSLQAPRPRSDSPSGPVSVYVQHETEINRRLCLRLGIKNRPPLKPREWAQLMGAQSGAIVHVFGSGFGSIEINVDHPDYSARRIIEKSKTITNVTMQVTPDMQRSGIATRALEQQAKSAARMGFKKINLWASGDGTELRSLSTSHLPHQPEQGGFYAWARLGFEGRIDSAMRRRVKSDFAELQASAADFAKRFPGVTHVSELMKSPAGRDWWKRFGEGFEGEFKLNDDSLSWCILRDYMKELRRREQRKSLSGPDWTDFNKSHPTAATGPNPESATAKTPAATPDSNAGECENPDQLTAEQEAILDQIWDRIGRES